MKVALEESTEVAQAALDAAAGAAPEKRKPITSAEQKAVLERFRLIDLLDLVIVAARHASNQMSMTVESTYPGVRVVVRVTHPRPKKAKSS